MAYEENVDEVIRVMREVGAALWDDDEWRQKPRAQPAVGGVEGLKTARDPERLFAAARAKGTGG